MSVNTNYTASPQKINRVALAGTTAETVVAAVPNWTYMLVGFWFANTTASAVACELYVNDGSNDLLIWHEEVAANTTSVEDRIVFRIESGHSIKAKGDSGVTACVLLGQTLQTQ
jgi:hypothetical protein